jgi:hypothetical protein
MLEKSQHAQAIKALGGKIGDSSLIKFIISGSTVRFQKLP